MHPTAERSATIRQQLKKLHGITSRQVSVKSDVYSLGSSIRITINDPAVDIREVQNVANRHERVDRDAYTGEILCGGNRHLFIEYSDEAAAKFQQANPMGIATLMLNIDEMGSGPVVLFGGVAHHIENEGDRLTLRSNATRRTSWLPDRRDITPVGVARCILGLREG